MLVLGIHEMVAVISRLVNMSGYLLTKNVDDINISITPCMIFFQYLFFVLFCNIYIWIYFILTNINQPLNFDARDNLNSVIVAFSLGVVLIYSF